MNLVSGNFVVWRTIWLVMKAFIAEPLASQFSTGTFSIDVRYIPVMGQLAFAPNLDAKEPPIVSDSELKCDTEIISLGETARCIATFRRGSEPSPVPGRHAVHAISITGVFYICVL